jgi:hypothetical protein
MDETAWRYFLRAHFHAGGIGSITVGGSLALALLSVRPVDTEKWKAVDSASPGGLSAEALALCSPTGTYLTDLQWHNARAARSLDHAI